MVISFLVLWFICLSSSLVHLNGPEYLMRVTAQIFIPLIRFLFLLYSFVSRSFLVLLKYDFLFFSFISSWLMMSTSNNPKYLYFSFSPGVPSVSCCFSLLAWRIFLCQTPFLCPWLYILTVCIRVSKSFSFFGKQFHVVLVH